MDEEEEKVDECCIVRDPKGPKKILLKLGGGGEDAILVATLGMGVRGQVPCGALCAAPAPQTL